MRMKNLKFGRHLTWMFHTLRRPAHAPVQESSARSAMFIVKGSEEPQAPLGAAWCAEAATRRQRRHSYQPRAMPWVYRPKTILSAESAIHCAEGFRRCDVRLSGSDPICPMTQAVGLQENKTARKPRALPWAGMNQAFGLPSGALRASGGFTMIEIAISLAIIAFALVAIIGILPFGMGVQRENREETIINQETGVLLNAICNGDQGLDDLTNYVVAITNTQTLYLPSGKPTTVVHGYTYSTSPLPINNGFNIVGLLSTPKYYPWYNNKQPPAFLGFYSNHVVATIRAMSGSASDKAPQNNPSVQEMAFAYRMTPELMPYGSGNPLVPNGSGNPLVPYSSAWYTDWTNYVKYPDQWHSNYFRYAVNLQADLNEVRLLFRWPALPNGGLGSGRQVVRAVTAGPLAPFPNPPAAPAFPPYRFFVQPKTFARAQ